MGEVTVLYFAAARERAGLDRERLPLAGKTVDDAVAALVEAHPDLGPIVEHCRVAVDQEFAPGDSVVPAGAELALIPPVAGGDSGRVRVLETALSVDEAIALIARPEAGAQVIMIGTVRDHVGGDAGDLAVESLEYEAYPAMAEKIVAGISREVEGEFPGTRVAVLHRTGHLEIGDRAVVVAVSAPHRAEAFGACQRVIDRLKEDAPIWKREHRAGGVVWVGLGP